MKIRLYVILICAMLCATTGLNAQHPQPPPQWGSYDIVYIDLNAISTGDGDGYTFDRINGTLTFIQRGNYEIEGADVMLDYHIDVIEELEVYVTLNGVHLQSSGNDPAFSIGERSTVYLTILGENTLQGGVSSAGLYVHGDNGNQATLHIQSGEEGSSLTAIGGDGIPSGGFGNVNYSGGAGIGGNGEFNVNSGDIYIWSGTIIAQGGNGDGPEIASERSSGGGAGIGGGGASNNVGGSTTGKIVIYNGDITANGGDGYGILSGFGGGGSFGGGGAGIGGGGGSGGSSGFSFEGGANANGIQILGPNAIISANAGAGSGYNRDAPNNGGGNGAAIGGGGGGTRTNGGNGGEWEINPNIEFTGKGSLGTPSDETKITVILSPETTTIDEGDDESLIAFIYINVIDNDGKPKNGELQNIIWYKPDELNHPPSTPYLEGLQHKKISLQALEAGTHYFYCVAAGEREEETSDPATVTVNSILYDLTFTAPVNGTVKYRIDEGPITPVLDATTINITDKSVVTLIAEEIPNFQFVEWAVVREGGGTDVYTTLEASFIMPANNVTVSAEFAQLYNVTVSKTPNNVDGLTATADPSVQRAGITVDLQAGVMPGYEFKEWEIVQGTFTIKEPNIAKTDFIMPRHNVEVRAIFELIPYGIFVDKTGNGTVKIGEHTCDMPDTKPCVTATKGETVTLQIINEVNSETESIKASYYDDDLEGIITLWDSDDHGVDDIEFDMPRYDVIIEAKFKNWGIALDKTDIHTFPSAIFGYTSAPPLNVTITNTGNQPTGQLTVTLEGNHNSFTLSKTTIKNIASGGTDNFTVVPNSGLNTGVHTAIITVAGVDGMGVSFSRTFNVRFEVTQKDLSNSQVNVSVNSAPLFTYDGAEQSIKAADVTVVVDMTTLTAGVDYTVSGSGVDAGSYSYTVYGQGNYSGEFEVTDVSKFFIIAPRPLTKDKNTNVVIGGSYTFINNNTSQTVSAADVSVTIEVGSPPYDSNILTLVYDTDPSKTDFAFAFAEGHGINAGISFVVITGHNNFTGIALGAITILRKQVPAPTPPTPIHTFDGFEKTSGLVSTAEYTVSGENNETNARVTPYEITLTLNNTPNENYEWSGTRESEKLMPLNFTWRIYKSAQIESGVHQTVHVTADRIYNFPFNLTDLLPGEPGVSVGAVYAPVITNNEHGVLGALNYVSGNILTLPISGNAKIEDLTATVTVTINSTNYEMYQAVITVVTDPRLPVFISINEEELENLVYATGVPQGYTGDIFFTDEEGVPITDFEDDDKTIPKDFVYSVLYASINDNIDGVAQAPVNAGSYRITVTVISDLFVGFGNFYYDIDRAQQQLTAENIPSVTFDESRVYELSGHAIRQIDGTYASGAIRYAVHAAGATGASITSGATTLNYTAPGTATITASSSGSANYYAAETTFTVTIIPKTIDEYAIPDVLTPVANAIPVRNVASATQYGGTVEWRDDKGNILGFGNRFNYFTRYTATITLTPRTGYTLAGMGANVFTVAGLPASNDAGSGTVTVTFPEYDVVPSTHAAVFFMLNDAERFVTPQVVARGSRATRPSENPVSATGDVFQGWFEKDAETPWNFNDGVENDELWLYARFTELDDFEEPVYATFFVDGVEWYTEILESGAKVNRPAIDPVKTNFAFAGWNTEDGYMWQFTKDIVTENITLYAEFKTIFTGQFTVTFDGNGGIPEKIVVIANGGYIIPELSLPTDPVREDYAFTGWYKSQYYAVANLWNFAIDRVNQNEILYAGWLPIIAPEKYTVIFDIVNEDGVTVYGADVKFDETELSGYIAAGVEPGKYTFTVSKTGYNNLTDEIIVVDRNIIVPIELVADGEPLDGYRVTFNITDKNIEEEIEGATVIFDGIRLSGYDIVGVEDGDYVYSVSKAGYKTVTGTISIDDEDETVDIELEKTYVTATYNIVFNIVESDNENTTVADASVIFNGAAVSGYIVAGVESGMYVYSVLKAGYKPIINGIAEVVNNNSVITVKLEKDGTPVGDSFTVTFNLFEIIDENEVTVIDARIIFDGIQLSGATVVGVKSGVYPYSVSKSGYVTKAGSVIVNDNLSVNVELVTGAVAFHTVTFNITDQWGVIIVDADVIFNGAVLTAGYTLLNVQPGEYHYIVSKTGYHSIIGRVTVSNENETVTVTLRKDETAPIELYTVTFTVLEENESDDVEIEGAMIVFNGITLSGSALAGVKSGEYPFSVYKAGYHLRTGRVTVVDGNVPIEVRLIKIAELVETYTVAFNIIDERGYVISGATIMFNGSLTAGYVVSGVENGFYRYTVSKNGYLPHSGEVHAGNNNVIENVTLYEDKANPVDIYHIEFHITDKSTGLPITGANTVFNGISLRQNIGVSVVFEIVYQTGEYHYSVSKDGYKTVTDLVSVTENDKNEIKIVEVELEPGKLDLYPVTFNITDKNGYTLTGASIIFNGAAATSYTLFDIEEGNYSYTVYKAGYQTVTGIADVNGNINIVDVELISDGSVDYYKLVFDIRDEDGEEVPEANVMLNGISLNDSYSTAGVLPGVYLYSVSKSGYRTVAERITVSAGAEKTVNVSVLLVETDEPELFDITFKIVDFLLNEEIEDATIMFNGNVLDSYETQAEAGEYYYIVSKEGNMTVRGTVTVENASVTETVIFRTDNAYYFAQYTIAFIVKDEDGNIVSDAKVVLNGVEVFEDESKPGTYVAEDVYSPGRYIYSVSKEEYITQAGRISLLGSNITVEIELEKGTPEVYNITFNTFDEAGILILNADITFNGVQLSGAAATDIQEGEYFYSVSKYGYFTVNGILKVSEDETLNITLVRNLAEEVSTVTFNVRDGSIVGPAITDATVMFDGQILSSYQVAGVRVGVSHRYPYIVTKDGYYPTEGAVNVINVTGGNHTQAVILNRIYRTVTFTITDQNGEPVTDATVTLETRLLTEGTDGIYTFADVLPRPLPYIYTVSKDGYNSIFNSIIVNEQDEDVSVTFVKIGSILSLTLKINGNLEIIIPDGIDYVYKIPLEKCGINRVEVTIDAPGSDIELDGMEDMELLIMELILDDFGDNKYVITVQGADYNLTINKPMPFENMVRMRWDYRYTVINNPATFVEYEWYDHNGNIVGTGQSFVDPHATPTVRGSLTYNYHVAARSEELGWIRSCLPDENLKIVAVTKVYPNPVAAGQPFYLEIEIEEEQLLDGAMIEVYDALGRRVHTQPVRTRLTELNAMYGSGSYVIILRGKENLVKDVKLIVD